MSRMMKLGMVLLIVALMGCENEVEKMPVDGVPSADAISVNTSIEELAEVDLGEIKIKFVQTTLGTESMLAIQEENSVYISETPLDALLSQQLTLLEIFKALAPEQEPPQALIESHAVEVRSMKREDVAVRDVQIDVNATTSKSTTACDTTAFSKPSTYEAIGTKRYLSNVQGWHYLGVNDLQYLSGKIMMTWCNDSTSSLGAGYSYSPQLNPGWINVDLPTVASGVRYRWLPIVNTVYGNCNTSSCTGDCWSAGDLCFANQYGYGMAAIASGSFYHLRTGVVYADF